MLGAPSLLLGFLYLGITLACAVGVTALLGSFWLLPSVRRNRALRARDGVSLVRTGLRTLATESALAQIRPELNASQEERVLGSAAFSVVFATEGLAFVNGRREYRLVCLLTWPEIDCAEVGAIEQRGRYYRCVTIRMHGGIDLPLVIGREYLGGAFPCSRVDAEKIRDIITRLSTNAPTISG